MDTTMSAEDVIDDLNEILELEHDAIAAYKAAVERLDTQAYKDKLSEFLADHQAHVEDLTNLVRGEGGTAEKDGDAKKVLTKGKVVLADLAGDEAILKAMKANEVQTNSKYEKAVEKGYANPIQSVVQKGLADERRHKAWVETTLDAL